jgi:hypothetical protein
VTQSFAQEESCKVDLETRRNSARTKVKLLAYGVRDDMRLFNELPLFKEEHYAYDNGNWGVEPGRLVPSEILLPGGIVSKVHIRPSSGISLKQTKTGLAVEHDGKVLSEAFVLPRPRFWDYTTQSGTPTKRLAHFYGATCLNFNIYSG